jgi:PAS domain S-box-containing protein
MSMTLAFIQASLLGEAVDSAPVAVLVADETGRYAAVNRYACEMLGYSRDELLTLSVTDVGASGDVEAHYQRFVAERFEEGTTTVRRKDGTLLAFTYRAGETKIAGMTYYVSVGAPVE